MMKVAVTKAEQCLIQIIDQVVFTRRRRYPPYDFIVGWACKPPCKALLGIQGNGPFTSMGMILECLGELFPGVIRETDLDEGTSRGWNEECSCVYRVVESLATLKTVGHNFLRSCAVASGVFTSPRNEATNWPVNSQQHHSNY